MERNYEKFIFLVVVIGLAFFARQAYPSTPIKQEATVVRSDPPVLVLAPPPGADPAPTAVQEPMQTPPANGTSSFTPTGNTPIPQLSDTAMLVADIGSGDVFGGTNATKRWPTASITKLMTATIAVDNIEQFAHIPVPPSVFAADPQEVTLVPNGVYTLDDLLHVLLMPSSNVAAEAIATFYGHTRFMDLMNARAREWGMKDTYFDDPSGISAANQSTANDMMILATHIYKDYPQILSVTDTPSTTITELTAERKYPVKSINNFAGQPDFIGGKTGHTDEAGGNLLSIFSYDDRPLLVIVLGSSERFHDTQILYNWFRTNFR